MNTLAAYYANKKVLVTGGCGFIGSHLSQKLVELGAHVTIIDDLSTGSLRNIESFKDQIEFINQTITNQNTCDRAVRSKNIVFHLAAFISVPGSVADPLSCHDVNVNGTFNLLNAAKKNKVARFIFSSSSSVYGPRDDACLETDTNVNPISPYGATKLMGELYCKQFSNVFNLPCTALRYFNVYGPRQNPHAAYAAVVAKFQHQLEHNEPITIFGDGTQTRDFISVADVVDANLISAMAPIEMVNGQIYNIGTGTSISLITLLENMKIKFPTYTGALYFEPPRNGDVKHTQMNAEKFNQLKATMPKR